MLRGLKASILKPINTSAVIILGMFTLLWGAWLSIPLWNVFDTAKVFHSMENLAPELFWGIMALLAGAVISWGVIRNSYHSLTTGSWIGFIQWGLITGLFFAGDWRNPAAIMAMAFAIYSAYVHLNLRVNRNAHNDPVEQDEFGVEK